MPDAIIQLPRHPLRCLTSVEQAVSNLDQIIIIQHPTDHFDRLVLGQECRAIMVKRFGQFATTLAGDCGQILRKFVLRVLLNSHHIGHRLANIFIR